MERESEKRNNTNLVKCVEFFGGHRHFAINPLELYLEVFKLNLISVSQLLCSGNFAVEAIYAILCFVDSGLIS